MKIYAYSNESFSVTIRSILIIFGTLNQSRSEGRRQIPAYMYMSGKKTAFFSERHPMSSRRLPVQVIVLFIVIKTFSDIFPNSLMFGDPQITF